LDVRRLENRDGGVQVGDVSMKEGDSSDDEGVDIKGLSHVARELADRARNWLAGHPVAALGIAVVTGMLVGRATRMWVRS
jgi:hypothetical protein